MNTFISNTIDTIRNATVSRQLLDIGTDVLNIGKYTAQGTVGSTLVVTTATRLATQGLASHAPKSKEEAEMQILLAIASMKNKVDTYKSESKKDSVNDTEQAMVIEGIS